MKMAQRAKDLAGATGDMGKEPASIQDAVLEIGMHKDEISRLRGRVDELEAGSSMGQRPISREMLPVMEGMAPLGGP